MLPCRCGCGKLTAPGFLGYTSACYQRIRHQKGYITTYCRDYGAAITSSVRGGRRSCRCEKCKIKHRKESAARRQRETHRLRSMGVDVDTCRILLAAQDNKCAICGRELTPWESGPDGRSGKNTHVDHDHKTGKIRGVLCINCNMGLGCFKDDTKLLRRAFEYLDASIC